MKINRLYIGITVDNEEVFLYSNDDRQLFNLNTKEKITALSIFTNFIRFNDVIKKIHFSEVQLLFSMKRIGLNC